MIFVSERCVFDMFVMFVMFDKQVMGVAVVGCSE